MADLGEIDILIQNFIDIDVTALSSTDVKTCRRIRNYIVEEPLMSTSLNSSNFLVNSLSKLRTIALRNINEQLQQIKKLKSPSSCDPDTLRSFTTAMCQLLSNFCAVSEVNRINLWRIFTRHNNLTLPKEPADSECHFGNGDPERAWQDLIAAAASVSSREALGAALSTIYQCIVYRSIDNNKKNDASLRDENGGLHSSFEYEMRFAQFLTWRAFHCQMLLTAADVRIQQNTPSPTSTPNIEEISSDQAKSIIEAKARPDPDPALEWLQFIVFRILMSSRFDEWFLLIGLRQSKVSLDVWSRSIDVRNHEQQLLVDSNGANGYPPEITQPLNVTLLSHEQVVTLQCLIAVLEDTRCSRDLITAHPDQLFGCVLKRLSTTLCQLLSSVSSSKLSAVDINPVCALLADAISAALVLMDIRSGTVLRSQLSIEFGLVPLLVRCVASEKGSVEMAEADSSRRSLQISNDSTEITIACLRLLSNLVYGCAEAQAALGEADGLLLVLSLCATDVHRPLRREWALICMRNACADCQSNQNAVEALTLQGVTVVNEQLKKSGLQVKFDKSNGSIRFEQQKN